MEGVAKALGLKPGYVVFLNLVMQVEEIGINCSNWNNTVPNPHTNPDPAVRSARLAHAPSPTRAPK